MYFKVDHVRDFDFFKKVFGGFLHSKEYNSLSFYIYPTKLADRDQCLMNHIYNKLKLYSLVIHIHEFTFVVDCSSS